jgi:hypothetical protein
MTLSRSELRQVTSCCFRRLFKIEHSRRNWKMGATVLDPSLRQSIAGRGGDLFVAGHCLVHIFHPERHHK